MLPADHEREAAEHLFLDQVGSAPDAAAEVVSEAFVVCHGGEAMRPDPLGTSGVPPVR
jgi:hypothetical protein